MAATNGSSKWQQLMAAADDSGKWQQQMAAYLYFLPILKVLFTVKSCVLTKLSSEAHCTAKSHCFNRTCKVPFSFKYMIVINSEVSEAASYK
jgi:hypothetical protein